MPESPSATPSLTILGGPLNGQSLGLGGPEMDFVLVGSDPTCHFSVGLPGVAPVHARLKRGPAGFVVQDARSERGTWVNDVRVSQESALRDGDVLWLGPPGDAGSVMVAFRFGKPPGAPAPTAAAATPIPGPSVPVPAPPIPIPAPPASPTPPAPDAGALDFLIDESAAAAVAPGPEPPPFEDFLIAPEGGPGPEPEGRGASAGDIVLQGSAPSPAGAEDAAFFVADEPSEPAALGAPSAEEFFVADPEPQAPESFAPAFVPEFEAPPPVATAAPAPAAPAPPPLPAAKAATAPAGPEPVKSPQRPADSPRPTPSPRKSATPPPRPARPAAAPSRPARSEAPSARPGRAGASPALPRLLAFGLLGLLVVGGGVFVLRGSGAPHVEAVSPPRARPGQTVTLQGTGFQANRERNAVRFGEKPGVVVSATTTRLDVEVPELPLLPGRDAQVPVTVQVGGAVAAPVSIALYQAPRIDGFSPDAAMPGEEVELAGGGWAASGTTVRFGGVAAEVLSASPHTLRVRVPALPNAPGTSVPVVIAVGTDESNAAPFTLGHLPLVLRADPASASPGDVVTVTGRGFQAQPVANTVKIGEARALVASATESELKVVVPWLRTRGEMPLEVRVPGSENVGRATLAVAEPPSDVVDFRFGVEALEEGSDRAVLTTELGPAFVISASGGRSAAQRAVEAAGRLNAAAIPLKASLDADFQVRNLESSPVVTLVGKTDPVLQVTPEDAAGYSQAGSKGAVSPARLAVWWNAVARDLVAVLVRSQKPQYALALAPETHALLDVYQAARKTGQFGVPRGVVTAARPPFRDALKTVALRVPASVRDPNPGAAVTAGPQDLQLEGTWKGSETIRGERNYVTLTFQGGIGRLAFGGTASLSVELTALEQPQKNAVRYSLEVNGIRYYSGLWDGHKIVGKVFSEPGDKGEIGTFELTPVG